MNKLRIILAEDHETIRDGLKLLVNSRSDMEVVGEAANRVSAQSRATHPDIHWREWIDTRNRVIHGYDTVELRIVFRIIRNNLPPLVAELERILEQRTNI